jgi:membrane dipeptidase
MVSSHAASIHESALILDGHADTPQRFLDDDWSFADPLGEGMLNLDTARRGNLAAEFFALWVDPAEHSEGTHFARAMALGRSVLAEIERNSQTLQLCLTAEDILGAKQSGRFGVLLSVEGGHAIENSLDKLHAFYDLGVRSLTLTWNNTNLWADSSAEAPRHHGLTSFGREVIREMNRLGILIDVSHSSDETFWQVLETSTAPIVATHSCARALASAPRNLTDEQLRALASVGGLCMVNFFPAFLSDAWRDAWNALAPKRHALHQQAAAPYRAAGQPVPHSVSSRIDRQIAARIPPVPLAALIDHIDHIATVAGIDAVGLGSDFDGIPALPDGLTSAADLPKITGALHQRGYTAGHLHKILGGNFLRTFEAATLNRFGG